MNRHNFFQDIQNKVENLFRLSPAKDLEAGIKAVLSQGLIRMDAVLREEFDIQSEILNRTCERVKQLEERIAELEKQIQSK